MPAADGVSGPQVDVGVPGPGRMGVDGAGAAQRADGQRRPRLDRPLRARDVRDEWHGETLIAAAQTAEHRDHDAEHHQHAARRQRQVQPLVQAADRPWPTMTSATCRMSPVVRSSASLILAPPHLHGRPTRRADQQCRNTQRGKRFTARSWQQRRSAGRRRRSATADADAHPRPPRGQLSQLAGPQRIGAVHRQRHASASSGDVDAEVCQRLPERASRPASVRGRRTHRPSGLVRLRDGVGEHPAVRDPVGRPELAGERRTARCRRRPRRAAARG